MKANRRAALVVFLSLIGLAACGGGGGGGDGGSSVPADTGPSVASLQGTWYGAYQKGGNNPYKVGFDVNGTGGITDFRINGISQHLTGSIAKVHGTIFEYTLSDKSTGGFFVDDAATHVAFLHENGDFGVLQKGASVLPSYTASDVLGSWSGYTVALNSNMDITKEGASSATIALAGAATTINGTDIFGKFTGSFTYSTTYTYGYYNGTWSSADGGSGNLRAWLSADTKFAAVWSCTGKLYLYVYSIPDCSFSAWKKQ